MIALLFGISLLYSFVIFNLIHKIKKEHVFEQSTDITSSENTYFSVLIPFRNEAQNIPELLTTLSKIEYPTSHFEIIFIDDASEDNSKSIIQECIQNTHLNIKVLNNKPYSNSPKKDAITLGVKNAKHSWIVTTDADCLVPSTWLSELNTFIKTEAPHFVAMPVLVKKKNSVVALFQYFETLALQGITLATYRLKRPFLCNGANLAYKKDLFFEVNGYEGNNHLASGDDIFLLEKIRKLANTNIRYVCSRNVLVTTSPEDSWSTSIQQRVRWASKTKTQKNTTALALGIVMLLSNISVIASLILVFIFPLKVMYWISFIFMKWITDGLLLKFTATTFQEDFDDSDTIIPLFVQPFLYCWIAVHSLKGNYTWKGREHRK